MGPGRDRTRIPWICSQTRICCQACYRLRYVAHSQESEQTRGAENKSCDWQAKGQLTMLRHTEPKRNLTLQWIRQTNNLPCLGTQSPRGTWPFNESGTPITAASAMYGLSMIAFKNLKQMSQCILKNLLCATSKGSDQPAHTHSLIRAFASRLNILWVLSYWLNIIWSF